MSRDYGRKYAGSRWQVYAMLEPLGWVSWRELHAMCQGYSARLRELPGTRRRTISAARAADGYSIQWKRQRRLSASCSSRVRFDVSTTIGR